MALPFTKSLTTTIGRIRARVGAADPAAPGRIEDARIQEYIDATSTEYDAALMLVDATIASLVGKIKTTQIPTASDVVQINDVQAQIEGWQTVRRNLLTTVPTTTTGLPVRRWGTQGRHPSDPWRVN